MNIKNLEALFKNDQIIYTREVDSGTFYVGIGENGDMKWVEGFSLCCSDYHDHINIGMKTSGFNLFHDDSVRFNLEGCTIEVVEKDELKSKVISEYEELFNDCIRKLLVGDIKLYSTAKNTYFTTGNVLYKRFVENTDELKFDNWYKFEISDSGRSAYSSKLRESIKVPRSLKVVDKQVVLDILNVNFEEVLTGLFKDLNIPIRNITEVR